MKTLLMLILILSWPYFLRAQTPPPQINFSNRVVTVTNLQGEQFKNIKLVRADAKGIIYVFANGDGGGRLHFTNLSATTLKELGVGTDTVEKEIKLTEQEAAQQKKLYEEEKEKMHDPANYRTVHLQSLVVTGPGTGRCTVLEFDKTGYFMVYNLPNRIIEYFKELQGEVESVNELKAQLDQVRTRESQNDVRIQTFKAMVASLKDESYHGRLNQANNPGNENFAWNVEMEHRQDQNDEQLQAAKDEQLVLENQLKQVQKSFDAADAKLKLFSDKRSGAACAVKVFLSLHQKYLGNPILICAADKDEKETPASGR